MKFVHRGLSGRQAPASPQPRDLCCSWLEAAFCIVSDHGFLPIRKVIRVNAALARAGLVKTRPDRTVEDWDASSWVSGGTAAVMTRTPEAAEKARAALKSIEGIGRIVEGAELKAMNGYPDATFVLTAARGYAFGDDVSGEVIRDSSSRGTHGYTPDERDMDASFFLVGPQVQGKGKLGRIEMRDVAPTLAALLGVTLPQAEGRNLLAH